jgi:hypothetical protein
LPRAYSIIHIIKAHAKLLISPKDSIILTGA